MRYDVVAIGGGFAGLVAANRAAQLGFKAAVLEKHTEERYLCNSRVSTGVSHILFRDMDQPAEVLAALINEAHAGGANPQLVQAFAATSKRALDWLHAEGQRFIRINTSNQMKNLVLAPPRRFKAGLDWEGRGSDVLLRRLEENLKARGGEFHRGTRATTLLTADGGCTGIEAVQNGRSIRIDARAIVLADGGFGGNLDLIRRWITPHADQLLIRSTASERGDCLLMAEAVGADLTGFGKFYGHPMHREALSNPNLWPFPMMDPICRAGIVVDARGLRFADEGLGGIVMANEIAHRADPRTTTVVFDETIWNGAGKEIGGANPLLASIGAAVHRANSLAELAGVAGLPADALANTVDRYNQALAAGMPAALDPPRTTLPMPAQPISKAPFYAVPLVSGITATMGGVRIDMGCRVLRRDEQPISGLYAAGSTVAGLEGGPSAIYMGGLSKAFIFGLLAAESIAADLGGPLG